MQNSNFTETYNDLYVRLSTEIENERKKVFLKIFLIVISGIVIAFFVFKGLSKGGRIAAAFMFMNVVIGFYLFFVAIFIALASRKYKKLYKKKVITALVESINESYIFDEKGGIDKSYYNKSQFDVGYDTYHTEDLITGNIGDNIYMNMCQVHTQETQVTHDRNGTHVHHITRFFGLFGFIELPFKNARDVSILNNSKFSHFAKDRVEMESAEFEKMFDVFTKATERISAMELLTPETIEQLVKLRKEFKCPINIRVKEDKIYFRIEAGDIFEAPLFRKSFNFDLLLKYYNLINSPKTIYDLLSNNLKMMN